MTSEPEVDEVDVEALLAAVNAAHQVWITADNLHQEADNLHQEALTAADDAQDVLAQAANKATQGARGMNVALTAAREAGVQVEYLEDERTYRVVGVAG